MVILKDEPRSNLMKNIEFAHFGAQRHTPSWLDDNNSLNHNANTGSEMSANKNKTSVFHYIYLETPTHTGINTHLTMHADLNNKLASSKIKKTNSNLEASCCCTAKKHRLFFIGRILP